FGTAARPPPPRWGRESVGMLTPFFQNGSEVGLDGFAGFSAAPSAAGFDLRPSSRFQKGTEARFSAAGFSGADFDFRPSSRFQKGAGAGFSTGAAGAGPAVCGGSDTIGSASALPLRVKVSSLFQNGVDFAPRSMAFGSFVALRPRERSRLYHGTCGSSSREGKSSARTGGLIGLGSGATTGSD